MKGSTPTGSTHQLKPGSGGVSSFVEAYQALLKGRPGMLASEAGGELAWLKRARERDANRWRSLGLPSRKTERWRYTSLAPIETASIALVALPTLSRPRTTYPTFETAGSEIVFLNGRFNAEWSRLPQEAGVSVILLSKIFEECVAMGWTKARMESFAAFRNHVETSDTDLETVFASMNTSFMQDAVLIRIAPSVVVEKPIVISYFSDIGVESSRLAMSSPRVFAHLEKGSKASVIECFAEIGRASCRERVCQYV